MKRCHLIENKKTIELELLLLSNSRSTEDKKKVARLRKELEKIQKKLDK
jgi:ABC-type Fe3+/spermidine/putrescine transport system ATPase subunit